MYRGNGIHRSWRSSRLRYICFHYPLNLFLTVRESGTGLRGAGPPTPTSQDKVPQASIHTPRLFVWPSNEPCVEAPHAEDPLGMSGLSLITANAPLTQRQRKELSIKRDTVLHDRRKLMEISRANCNLVDEVHHARWDYMWLLSFTRAAMTVKSVMYTDRRRGH